jgi:steroid 5-alpha reductase family enzyme
MEVVADQQKSNFKLNPNNRDSFITSGLWSWSRHPNYFGEITLWIGIAIIAAPTISGWQSVAYISPVFIIFLLTRVSGVNLLEARGLKRWSGNSEYMAYLERTSVLIPLPPKK